MKNNLRINLFVFVLMCYANILYSQDVISANGNHAIGNAVQVSWTIGEPALETGMNGQYYLTQGMHQGDMVVTAISQSAKLDFDITAFPNPVTNHLKLNVGSSNFKGLQYALYNDKGQLLDEGSVESEQTIIPMAKYSPSSFLLKVSSNNMELKLFKIIKRE